MVFVNAIESASIQNFVFSLAVHRKSFPRAMPSPVKWMPIDFTNYNDESFFLFRDSKVSEYQYYEFVAIDQFHDREGIDA